MDLSQTRVMGILNVTPDSFFAPSRAENLECVRDRALELVAEGADILDIGAQSTRPTATVLTAEEEWRRLAPALAAVREVLPEVPISVDTFYATVARQAATEYQVDIINDISGGDADTEMLESVAALGLPYVLTHNDPWLAQHSHLSSDEVLAAVARYLAERMERLRASGVADIIIDPGFGFGKTLEQNYLIAGRLRELIRTLSASPFLVGFSRKSMIYKLLQSTPEAALNGTTVLNVHALEAGAHLLRVHDVREAAEAIRICKALGTPDPHNI